jgi:hypothetical protein
MIPLSTVRLLRQWAAWGQGQSLDYPSMSPMFGERALKTPLYGATHMPDGIAEMEHAVCMLDFTDRYIIIQRWCRHRSYRQLAAQVGVSVWRISRLLKGAESELHRQFELIYDLRDALVQANKACYIQSRLHNCHQRT